MADQKSEQEKSWNQSLTCEYYMSQEQLELWTVWAPLGGSTWINRVKVTIDASYVYFFIFTKNYGCVASGNPHNYTIITHLSDNEVEACGDLENLRWKGVERVTMISHLGFRLPISYPKSRWFLWVPHLVVHDRRLFWSPRDKIL